MCLRCPEEFDSEGPGHRICPTCSEDIALFPLPPRRFKFISQRYSRTERQYRHLSGEETDDNA